ncbi:hypothetical protein D6D03_00313 [Aureobasidium pullulans]|nr:hypothetical protein D6D03_00313 [Aureobasidium pullulans]
MSVQISTFSPARNQSLRSLLLQLQLQDIPETETVFEYLSQPLLAQASASDRLAILQMLLPKTELQLEYWFNSDSNPHNWAITFPHLVHEGSKAHDTMRRYFKTIDQRHLKLTWKEFCASSVKDTFFQHTNTVTFAVRLRGPAYMYVIATFESDTLPTFEAEFFELEECFITLDADYIREQVEMKLEKWSTDFLEPISLSTGLIEAMVDDLREMKDGGCWPLPCFSFDS